MRGTIIELLHEPGRGAPLALVEFEDGTATCLSVPEGVSVGQTIIRGSNATADIGNILPLGKVPEGTLICNIEFEPGDGGRLAKASGTYATVVSHGAVGTEVVLPSGKSRYLDDNCRAMVGVVAGTGRTEKPFLRAGTKRHWLESKGRVWPITSGQAMVSASHPHGGGRHKHAGKPTTVSRNAPPGRKVGLIAARQSGRAKRRAR